MVATPQALRTLPGLLFVSLLACGAAPLVAQVTIEHGEFRVLSSPGSATMPAPREPSSSCSDGVVLDDGSFDSRFHFFHPNAHLIQAFTPPAGTPRVEQVCVCWSHSGFGSALNFEVVLFDDDGPGGTPGTLLGTVPASAIDIPSDIGGAFTSVDVAAANISIPSGRVYIGVRYDGETHDNIGLCLDRGSPRTTTIYASDGGMGWAPLDDIFPGVALKALGIRAVFGEIGLDADFSWSPAFPLAGDPVQLTDTSGGEPESWSWDFGDGATSTEQNPSHTYATAGAYPVTLTVSAGAATSSRTRTVPVGACVPDERTLCLSGGRFAAHLDWRPPRQGDLRPARVVPLGSENSGMFYFRDPDNWEMLFKVLDGCAFNGHYWVFFAATTNVEFALTVTDTQTGETSDYTNPPGTAALPVQDLRAFATCP